MADPRYWAWWSDKLAGADVPMSEGTPYAGFYRAVRKNRYGGKRFAEPVAYWPGENGELHCRVGDRDVTEQHGRDIWVSVGHNPVPEDWYREVTEKEPPNTMWRDGLPLRPGIGDNEPPEDIAAKLLAHLKEITAWTDKTDDCLADIAQSWIDLFGILQGPINELSEQAAKRIAGPPITEQAEADSVGKMADALSDLWDLVEDARKLEKKPYDAELKRIQAKWEPLRSKAEIYENVKYKLITPWLKKVEADQKRAAEEAAVLGEEAPEVERPRVSGSRRAMSLRHTKFADINDYRACLEFFADSEIMHGLVQDLANKAVRAGLTVPGVTVREDSKAV